MNSISSILFARVQILVIASLVSFTFLTTTPALAAAAKEASAIVNYPEQRYANATSLRNLTTALKSKILSNELKKAILEAARPEDRSFAQSIVVKWKAYTDKNIHTEFDELVVQDDSGKELLRLQPMPEQGILLLNGREWTAPEKGSIEKSLRNHLANSSAQNFPRTRDAGKFASFTPIFAPKAAWAAGETSPALAAAYVFTTTLSDSHGKKIPSFTVPAPVEAAAVLGIEKTNLRQNENAVRGFYRAVTLRPIEVVCRGSTAAGRAEVGGVKTKFETRADGKILFQLEDVAGTRLLVTPKIEDSSAGAKRGLSDIAEFHTGGDKDKALAQKILGDFQSLRKFNDTAFTVVAIEVDLASSRMPATSAVLNVEKSIAGYYTEHLQPLVTENITVEQCVRKDDVAGVAVTETFGGKCDKVKLAAAREQTLYKWTKATSDPANAQNDIRDAMLGLRTLGSCCASEPCRRSLESFDVQLKQESNSGGTKR